MKKTLISIIAVLVAITAIAQNMTVRDRQQFRLEAFRTLDEYQYYLSRVDSENDRADEFLNLFASDSIPVFNDLLGFNDADFLDVVTYVDELGNCSMIDTEIKGLDFGQVTYDQGKWLLDVNFHKSLRYRNNCMVDFDSEYYYDGADFDLTARLQWFPEQQKAKIVGIDGSISSSKPRIGKEYTAVRRTNPKYDERIRVRNYGPISFTGTGYTYFACSPDELQIDFNDPDVVAIKTVDPRRKGCDNLYIIQYKPRRMRIRPYFNMAIGNYYTTTTNTNFNLSEDSSSGMEMGVDFGYGMPMPGKLKISLYAGLGMASSKLKLGIANSNFSYETKQDIDGDTYYRQYQNVTLTQEQSYTDLVVPVYFDLDLAISRSISIFADLGIRAYVPLAQSTKSISGQYQVNGLYKDYNNLILDSSAGINKFTENGKIDGSNVTPVEIKRNSFSMDVFGRLGLRIPVWKTLSVEVSAQFQKGIGDCYTNTTKPDSNVDLISEGHAPIQYQYDNNGGVEKVNMPAMITKFSHQALSVGIGLVYKF